MDRAPAPGIREVMGSIAVGDSDFFFVSCLCPCVMLIGSLFTMYFSVFFFFKDELNATRYCGPEEFVSCAGVIESKEGAKPKNRLLSDLFHIVGKSINKK